MGLLIGGGGWKTREHEQRLLSIVILMRHGMAWHPLVVVLDTCRLTLSSVKAIQTDFHNSMI